MFDTQPISQNTATPRVRLARSKDQNKVRELFGGLLSNKQERQLGKVFDGIKNGYFNDCSEHILVLENNDGEVIGAVMFGHKPEIYALKVSDTYTGQNYGKLLVSAVAAFAKATEQSKIHLSSTQHSVGYWEKLRFTSGEMEVMRSCTEMTCKNITPLCEHFENNKSYFDSDYIKILNEIVFESFMVRTEKPSLITERIYREYLGYSEKPKNAIGEKEIIEQLKSEVAKYFGQDGNYLNRSFIKRDPQRDTLLNTVRKLINTDTYNLYTILTGLGVLGNKAQKHHEETSGTRFLGCGPLINKTCGFKKAMDAIIAKFKEQHADEKTSLLKNI